MDPLEIIKNPLEIRKKFLSRISQMESDFVSRKIMAYTYLVGIPLKQLDTISSGSEANVQEFVDEAKRRLQEIMDSPEMEFLELAKVLYARILNMESDVFCKKVIGNIFSHGIQKQVLLDLACGSEVALIGFIQKAKKDFAMSPYPAGLIPCVSSSNTDPVGKLMDEDQLELEIIEILKLDGFAISIARLPSIYYQKFHRNIEDCQGDFMEVIHRSRNIRLIDRPGKDPVIVLVGNLSESRKVFATFQHVTNFTAEDIMTYFSAYGEVEEVEMKPLYCFVEFKMAETVNLVLVNGDITLHLIQGSRVLVKKYLSEKAHLPQTNDLSGTTGMNKEDDALPSGLPDNFFNFVNEEDGLPKGTGA